MKIQVVEPTIVRIGERNETSHVAKCARVCYGKETGNDENTIAHLHANRHFSMFRHSTKYFIVPKYEIAANMTIDVINTLIELSYVIAGINIELKDYKYFIVCNGHFCIDQFELINAIKEFEVKVLILLNKVCLI